ncbi:MAG: hypothetical protein LBS12_03575, partial [Prevotellaceae bacterium]|nr:hypothetical protein [Prevotellaceae bacterium]
HDFDYIRVNLSLSQVLWLCVVQIIFQILVFLYLSVFIRRRRRIQKKYSTNNLPPDDWQRHVKTVIHMNTMFLAMAVIFVLISGRHWLSVGSWHFSFWYIILRLPSLCVLLALPIFMQNIIILKGLMKVKQAGGA